MDSKCSYLVVPVGVLNWTETVCYRCSLSLLSEIRCCVPMGGHRAIHAIHGTQKHAIDYLCSLLVTKMRSRHENADLPTVGSCSRIL